MPLLTCGICCCPCDVIGGEEGGGALVGRDNLGHCRHAFVVIVTLVVAVLALRNTRRTGELAEKLAERQLEDRESFEIIRGLRQGLDWERQERKNLCEELNQERKERLRAQQALVKTQQRAENAEQKAMREATRQLRERMDDYLKELGEAGTWSGDGGIRRVK